MSMPAPNGSAIEPAAAEREPPIDREARSAAYRWSVHLYLPLAASLGIHAVLFGALWWFGAGLLAQPNGAPAGDTVISITAADGDARADALRWDAPEAPAAGAPAIEAQHDLGAAPGALDLSAFAAVPRGDEGGFGAGEMGAAGVLGVGGGVRESTGGAGLGEGFGLGGPVESANVWGVRVAGRRFAYVVDFSGSIIVAVDALRKELCRSVGRLQPYQEFNVVVFYSSAGRQQEQLVTESFAPQLVPAEPDTKRRFFDWIAGKSPSGSTEPLAAMKRALSFRPQAVFFFSDGYFDDAVVDETARLNQDAEAQIHCLVFDELLLQDTSGLPRPTDGVRRLERIAQANRGQIRVVTGADLVQP
ncbi:MAG: hypothetical protein HRF50_04185 [Phycisphaerae bacterium]|jgi:hypothetical protein